MARKVKPIDNAKNELFGGASTALERDVVDAPVKDVHWNTQEIAAKSDTKLEDDHGEGAAAVIRIFDFAVNPEAFKQHKPSKQELFNSHLKGIEIILWRDGLKLFTDVPPKLTISKNKRNYRIIVAAIPMRGQLLTQTPQTLSELAHDTRTNRQ